MEWVSWTGGLNVINSVIPGNPTMKPHRENEPADSGIKDQETLDAFASAIGFTWGGEVLFKQPPESKKNGLSYQARGGVAPMR